MATSGTSGGQGGTSGRAPNLRLRLALVMLAGFVTVLALITIGNAQSMVSDFESAHVPFTLRHVWIWQISSVVAWGLMAVPIWWVTARMWPPRFPWWQMAAVFVAGLFVASAGHIALMILFRTIVYAAWEGARYHFQGNLDNPYLYEFRKDIATYLQFVLLALICQWLLARVGAAPTVIVQADAAPVLAVQEGTVTHRVPVDEVDQVSAAGNYVELPWRGRVLLHRATLAAVEEELGDRFVRIHRGRLVRRAAIRAVETNQAGDFEVTLADGAKVKGSRRYRAGVEG